MTQRSNVARFGKDVALLQGHRGVVRPTIMRIFLVLVILLAMPILFVLVISAFRIVLAFVVPIVILAGELLHAMFITNRFGPIARSTGRRSQQDVHALAD